METSPLRRLRVALENFTDGKLSADGIYACFRGSADGRRSRLALTHDSFWCKCFVVRTCCHYLICDYNKRHGFWLAI